MNMYTREEKKSTISHSFITSGKSLSAYHRGETPVMVKQRESVLYTEK